MPRRRRSLFSIESGPATVHWSPGSSRFVRVFSNCEEVALFRDGDLVERRGPDRDRLSTHLTHPPFTFDVGEFSFGVGATYYDYTDNFDDNYTEANLSASWKWFTVNADIGKYDGFGDDQDYQHYALTWEYEGFHLKAATFEDDFDGSYYEVGYSTEVGGFDLSGAYIYSDDDLVGGEDNSNLMFTISKTFGLID